MSPPSDTDEMKRIGVKVRVSLRERVEAYADEHHEENLSETVRALLEGGLEHRSTLRAREREHAEQLREVIEECDQLATRCERLERTLAATNARNDDHQELVEYVEEERSLQKRREERRRQREQASILTRAKWWLTGRPADEPPAES